jgi:hypothetical protein
LRLAPCLISPVGDHLPLTDYRWVA